MSSNEIHICHADAGSGKSFWLFQMIEKHVREGTPLNRIAYVTYTKAATEDAKQKVCERFGIDIKQAPHFRTIHSMCYHSLGCRISDMMDLQKYVQFGKQTNRRFSFKSDASESVDWANIKDDQLLSLEQLYRNNHPMAVQVMKDKISSAEFLRFCKDYYDFKIRTHSRDFTDLLQQYLREDKSEDVDVVCIDEAQDSTLLQWQVMMKAFRNAKVTYIVGDVKQSLYGFNGGAPEILTQLRGQQHTLEKSYRVPSRINDFIRHSIYSRMTGVHPTQLLSEHAGGEVQHTVWLDKLGTIDASKSYMFLARNRCFLDAYKDWCTENCIPFTYLKEPLFTNAEKIQFKNGLTQTWGEQKLLLAQQYMDAGTFYDTPCVHIDTIHGVKGLEADTVVLMPDMSNLTFQEYNRDRQGEHRVFYVACTRAKEKLIILEPTNKYYYKELF